MLPSEMTPDQLRREVTGAAAYFALLWYRRECPGATEEQSERWACRHWRKFVDRALDFLALRAAVEEKEGRGFRSPPPAG